MKFAVTAQPPISLTIPFGVPVVPLVYKVYKISLLFNILHSTKTSFGILFISSFKIKVLIPLSEISFSETLSALFLWKSRIWHSFSNLLNLRALVTKV